MQARALPSALLIIDMQVGLFSGPEQPCQAARLLDNVNRLIHKARAAGAPIFAVRHTGPQGSPIEAGSPLWQCHPGLNLNPAQDTLFDKSRPSCFNGTDLAERLAKAGIQQLVIAGMKTQYCIDTNCRIASDLGLNPILVSDAHSCMDTPILPAQAIIDHHNATLSGPFVRLQSTDEVVF
jgi:nicotinamidase-related amidase